MSLVMRHSGAGGGCYCGWDGFSGSKGQKVCGCCVFPDGDRWYATTPSMTGARDGDSGFFFMFRYGVVASLFRARDVKMVMSMRFLH